MDRFEREKAELAIEVEQTTEAYYAAIDSINKVFNNPRAAMEILCFLQAWKNIGEVNARRRKFDEEEKFREEKRALRKRKWK